MRIDARFPSLADQKWNVLSLTVLSPTVLAASVLRSSNPRVLPDSCSPGTRFLNPSHTGGRCVRFLCACRRPALSPKATGRRLGGLCGGTCGLFRRRRNPSGVSAFLLPFLRRGSLVHGCWLWGDRFVATLRCSHRTCHAQGPRRSRCRGQRRGA